MTSNIRDINTVFSNACDSSIEKKPFFITSTNTYTYKTFTTRVKKLITLFDDKKLKSGSRVVLSLTNDYDMSCVFVALILHDVVAIPIAPSTKKNNIERLLDNTKVDGWIIDSDNVHEWKVDTHGFALSIDQPKKKTSSLVNKLLRKKTEVVQNTLDDVLKQYAPSEPSSSISVQSQALLMFTSGTTSDAKGVIHTHKNICYHLNTLSRQYELDSSSVISNILPLYHVDGLIQGVLLTLYNQVTLSRPFDFEIPKIPEFLDTIYKHRVSHLFSVPTMLSLLYQFSDGLEDCFNTQEFKYVICSADVLQIELWRKFMSKFNTRVLNVYGLTETVAGSLYCGPDDESWRVGTIGKPVDCEAKVVDEDHNEVAVGEVGELALRGDHIISSYLIPPENPDSEGWFYTGDLVMKDCDGFYYLKGRKKNLIVKGGINIYPEEIIETLNAHPEIADAYIYGENDDTWGQRIVAVIKPSVGETPDIDQIENYCSKHLEDHKVPSSFHLVDEIPKTASGKILADKVRLLLDNKNNNSGAVDKKSSIQKEVLVLASNAFNHKVKEEDIHTHSKNMEGWNSLAHLDFAVQIEKHFDIELSTRDIMNIGSLDDAISILVKKLDT